MLAALAASACAGPDHLLEPVLAEGGAFFASVGGRTSSAGGAQNTANSGTIIGTLGGTANTITSSRTLADASEFDWGDAAYDSNGGADVAYQEGHYPGLPCFASCHEHIITFGGTVYQVDGTTKAANAQIGLLVNGILTATYAGTVGNFYATASPSDFDWATAKMAVRTGKGMYVMPANANANGNCNNCHKNSTNRIVAP